MWAKRQEDADRGMRLVGGISVAVIITALVIGGFLLVRSCVLLAEDNRTLRKDLEVEVYRANTFQSDLSACREVGIEWKRSPQRAALKGGAK